ncbi:glycosyltransferase family 4 protein [Marinobacter sp.]|uniref:glycosyltransferase family 4 protein n=1 Tax=Marinobacter sp. TaxID=50741 RepID=UPI0035C6BF7E
MSGKESILFVIDQFVNPYAGTESQLFKLLENLPRLGFEPHLLVLRDSEFVRSGRIPCSVCALPHHKLLDPRTWWHLWMFGRRMRKNGVRLAHVFFNDASILCPPVFRAIGLRTLISRRDMGYWYTPLLIRLLRCTRRWVAGVVVNSEAVSEVTRKNEGFGLEHISVIYNGYEHAKDRSPSKGIPDLEYFSRSGPVAFLVANIRPIKRIQDAILAIAKLKKIGRHLNLVVIGGGDAYDLRAFAREQGIEEQVLFAGSRPDVSYWLVNGFVGLSCSESEGYSNAVVEYMQAGLPVVASDVGGNCEAVLDGETGFRFLPGDVENLAKRLADLLDNPEQASKMGAAGRRLAEERHGLEKMLRAHADLYQRLLGPSAVTPSKAGTKENWT